MLTNILATLLLAAALGAIFIMMIAGIDTALRETYKRHALRYARERYRKWCAQTPVKVDKKLVVVCGKGYENDSAGMAVDR